MAVLQHKISRSDRRSKYFNSLVNYCLIKLNSQIHFEHAYYLDYRNERAKFIEAFWKIVNWKEAEKRLS